jgi:hypothetical protein
MLTQVPTYFITTWTDYVVRTHELYETNIAVSDIYASENLILTALNLNSYTGFDGEAYGVTTTLGRGITEQESYNTWIGVFQSKQRLFRKQILALGVTTMPQSVYDGLMLYYWITGDILTVKSGEGIYDTKEPIIRKEWDTVASMIMRSNVYKQHCIRAATILRLADYGKPKSRTWLRTNGIYKMRADNQIGLLNDEQLRRARFAYYAETLDFLPLTPNSIKRDIAKRYEETLLVKKFTYNGTVNLFDMGSAISMTPVEKLQVKVNGDIIQHLFDFNITEGSSFTITKEMTTNDIIFATLKI